VWRSSRHPAIDDRHCSGDSGWLCAGHPGAVRAGQRLLALKWFGFPLLGLRCVVGALDAGGAVDGRLLALSRALAGTSHMLLFGSCIL